MYRVTLVAGAGDTLACSSLAIEPEGGDRAVGGRPPGGSTLAFGICGGAPVRASERVP